MTASKRYVPVCLVCLLIAGTSAAMAGHTSMLDPYSGVQAPTAKEIEAKTNKARAKKGLPPIHAAQLNSSTVVEDATLSPTTYVTAPGGGNGKVVKGNDIAESKSSAPGKGGKVFGFGMPNISMPKVGLPGFGKKSEKSEPEVKVAKAQKAAPQKDSVLSDLEPETPVAKETAVAKETVVVETTKTAAAPSNDGNVYTKTLKNTTSGMVNGSKKIGSGIASGAKASGGFFAKGASMVGHGFKATGEKIKDGGSSMGKMAHMPHLFKKGESRVANNGLPQPFPKQSAETKAKLAAKAPKAKASAPSALSQPDGLAAESRTAIAQPDDLVQESNPAPKTAAANVPLGVNDELVPDSKRGKKGGLSLPKFNLNPFAKKVAGKKQNTL